MTDSMRRVDATLFCRREEVGTMDAFVTGGSGFVGRRLLAALADRGDDARALARSEASAETVAARDAEPVRGDLSAVETMAEGMADCGVVFHLAAKVDEWGDPAAFRRVNVEGTENALAAARRADVDRVVHASTEAVLADGSPKRDVDESHPLPDEPVGYYPRTKAEAERRVRAADGDGLRTTIVRPRFVWGVGDTTLLPELVGAVRAGRFAWFDGGRYRTSTCHVDNAVEGFLLAAEHGSGGEAYFLTDGDPVEFRAFVTDLLATQGVKPPERSVPWRLAWWAARAGEAAWRTLPLSGQPPLTTMSVATIGQPMTVDDSKAREELGYEAAVSRAEGLEALRTAASVDGGRSAPGS
jgi:nucleoside-diphosphate-sugar epimerase